MVIKDIKIFLLIIFINASLLHLPAFFVPHNENDEVIYQTLIEKTTFKLKDYTLQGTKILEKLPKVNYNFPVFHHPPLFIFAGALVNKLFGRNLIILIPVLSNILTIFLVYKIGSKLYNHQTGLLAATILTICPISLFTASKIWLDSFLTLGLTLVIYFILEIKKNNLYALAAGLIFALSLMVKYSAVFILPIVFLVIVLNKKVWSEKLKTFLFFLMPLVLTIPWFNYNYQQLGKIFPNQRLSAEGVEMFPFLAMVAKRPIYFYLFQTIILMPLYLLAFRKMLKLSFIKKNIILISWFLTFLASLTVYGIIGGSYQMRYILPIIPPLTILTAHSLPKLTSITILGLIIISIYGLLTGIFNSYIWRPADLIPIFKIFF